VNSTRKGSRLDTSSIKDWGFDGLAVIFFAIVIYRLLPTKAPKKVAVSAVILAMFCAVLGNPDRIASLKIWGFETQTREVQKVIDNANDAIALLRKLAVVTASLQVKMLAAEGRLQGPASLLQKDAQKDELLVELKNIGLTDKEIATVAAADSAWVKWDYVINILQPINSENDRAKIVAYTKAYGRFTNPLSPEECEEVLKEFNATSDQTDALLDDYRYYLKFGKHRRLEVWKQRPTGLRVAPSAMLPLR
jgi:hypothetical protein